MSQSQTPCWELDARAEGEAMWRAKTADALVNGLSWKPRVYQGKIRDDRWEADLECLTDDVEEPLALRFRIEQLVSGRYAGYFQAVEHGATEGVNSRSFKCENFEKLERQLCDHACQFLTALGYPPIAAEEVANVAF